MTESVNDLSADALGLEVPHVVRFFQCVKRVAIQHSNPLL